MARVVGIAGQPEARLATWRMAVSPADACATPKDAEKLADWIDAEAPGTAAGALKRAGHDPAQPLHDKEVWWRCELEASGRHRLSFAGLATSAEVWLGDTPILSGASMYFAQEVEADLTGGETLWMCFRSLEPLLDRKLPRARWRTQLVPRQAWRGVRATLLGQMPGWAPTVDAVGPWRPVTIAPAAPIRVEAVELKAGYEDGEGRLTARVRLSGAKGDIQLTCAGHTAQLALDADGAYTGDLRLADIEPWWPHTHGAQPLYPVILQAGGVDIDLGRTGFRSLEVDRGPDGQGFGLVINGQPVFCRGAVWTGLDIVDLPCERERYEPLLRLARDGGMNMLRVAGIGAYEGPAFFELCDELGILVWQEFMFSNFDYPASSFEFAAVVEQEARQVLDAVQLSPSLVVACGGSEVFQQATMLGLEPVVFESPLYEAILPDAVSDIRPDIAWVPNSPSGGALPFAPNQGVAHYYGVGAYMRPLEDARRAEVRFAAECLAFANPPADATVQLLTDRTGAPKDLGTDWDFADTREHYLQRLHGHAPEGLRKTDPERYLQLSQLVAGQVMEATFGEWRRARSTCRGALVFTFKDLWPGAGWGVVDDAGRPKPCWYALKRAFRPLHLALTDEGNSGLAIHMVNESAHALDLELEIAALLPDGRIDAQARAPAPLEPRQAIELNAWTVLGAFHDLNGAYRFGPLRHCMVVCRLRDGEGAVVAEAFHLPDRAPAFAQPEVTARLDGTALFLTTDRPVRFVRVSAPGWLPSDDGFHLAPGAEKIVKLDGAGGAPQGRITGLDHGLLATFGSAKAVPGRSRSGRRKG